MDRRALLSLVLYTVPAALLADPRKKLTIRQCQSLSRQINRVDSQLRDGHSSRRGRSLKRRRRELQLRRFRGCR